jgi:pyruvate dehydrogenase E2 component (dihydrolipoamide acetyltransferase)
MPISILMPALSPTMEQGKLAKWLKKEGDKIKSGDVLAEIETDKATMEVEAVDEGILAKIVIPDGTDNVAVNALIGIIASEGEDVAQAAAGGGEGHTATSKPLAVESPSSMQTAGVPETSSGAAPHVATQAIDHNTGRIFASPLAKRLAQQGGVDLSRMTGSGPHGRIIAADVEAAASGKVAMKPSQASVTAPASSSAKPAPISSAMSDEMTKKLFPEGSFEEIPHDGMRKTIARRLLESKQTVPHFYVSTDCQLDALLSLREQINASAPKDKEGKPSFKLSVNDMVIKAMALALKAVPDANVSWTENTMLKHRHADVGVAVSIPGGLITPVIRKACCKSLSTISNEMKDLAGRAKARKLKPDEYQGGTTAVSNLGMFGVKNFAAIVNPPHATILAVGAGEKRAVVKGDQLAVATVMTVTLSTDHRAVDGALGAELIAAFKGFIEQPLSMLV